MLLITPEVIVAQLRASELRGLAVALDKRALNGVLLLRQRSERSKHCSERQCSH